MNKVYRVLEKTVMAPDNRFIGIVKYDSSGSFSEGTLIRTTEYVHFKQDADYPYIRGFAETQSGTQYIFL